MVEFDAGSFSSSGPMYEKVTEFVLDRTVDVVLGLQVDQNDGGLLLGLVLRTPGGGPAIVKTSRVFQGIASIEIRFDAVPAGIYSIVVQSISGSVAGSYRARWENRDAEVVSTEDVSLALPDSPQFDQQLDLTVDADVPEVPVLLIDPVQ